jgi:hypothetical protein
MDMEAHSNQPGYTAKIVKHGSELIFDFSHLKNQPIDQDFEKMVMEWSEQHDGVARNCSAFILRLPSGELKNFVPNIQAQRIMQ